MGDLAIVSEVVSAFENEIRKLPNLSEGALNSRIHQDFVKTDA